MADKVILHRCSWTFLKVDLDACHRVQKALDEQGIDYEVVKHGYGKGKRPEVVALSGQKLLPVLELPGGEAYRAESQDMAARVRAGGITPA
jgi:glutathione S-transferase